MKSVALPLRVSVSSPFTTLIRASSPISNKSLKGAIIDDFVTIMDKPADDSRKNK
jgi:hypothetical protein